MNENLPCTLRSRWLALKRKSATYLFVENRENTPNHYVSLLEQTWHVKPTEQFTARDCVQVENQQR